MSSATSYKAVRDLSNPAGSLAFRFRNTVAHQAVSGSSKDWMSLIQNDDLIVASRVLKLPLCAAQCIGEPGQRCVAAIRKECPMERTRNPLDDLGVFAAMATAPLIANAILTANALSAEPEQDDRHADRDAGANAGEDGSVGPKRGWFDRIDEWFWKLEQRELEERLAAATDIYDLEARMRAIERGYRSWSN